MKLVATTHKPRVRARNIPRADDRSGAITRDAPGGTVLVILSFVPGDTA